MRIRALITVLAVAACATGCSSKESSKKSAGGGETKPEATTGPRRGGHIRVPSAEPEYLNPIIQRRFNRATPLIFEGLVGLDSTLEPVPALAQSWDISKDGKTITFRLRKDVQWHDGKPFTSKDVAFTFEAMRSTALPTGWKGYFADVDAVETPDSHTVVVKYKKAYAPALVTWTMGLLPEHVYGGKDFDEAQNQEPVGTGPYKLSRWEAGQRIILVANEHWWHERANLDSIELVIDPAKPFDALDHGDLDFAQLDAVEDWTTRTQDPSFRERFEVENVVESRFRTIAWNTQKKPFDDKRVRLALTLALNRDQVIDNVLRGQAQPLSAPFFPNMFGLDRSIAPHPFDLDRAVKLLDEAGYPSKDGHRFTIELNVHPSLQGGTSDEMLAIFRRDLGAIGITLKVHYTTSKDFFGAIRSHKFDASYFGWLADIPDPDPYSLLHSSQIDSGYNFAGLSNPQVDALLEEARNTLNRDERRVLYQKLHALLHDEMPYTPLYAPYSRYAWSRRLRAVNPSDIGPQPRLPGIAGWYQAAP